MTVSLIGSHLNSKKWLSVHSTFLPEFNSATELSYLATNALHVHASYRISLMSIRSTWHVSNCCTIYDLQRWLWELKIIRRLASTSCGGVSKSGGKSSPLDPSFTFGPLSKFPLSHLSPPFSLPSPVPIAQPSPKYSYGSPGSAANSPTDPSVTQLSDGFWCIFCLISHLFWLVLVLAILLND